MDSTSRSRPVGTGRHPVAVDRQVDGGHRAGRRQVDGGLRGALLREDGGRQAGRRAVGRRAVGIQVGLRVADRQAVGIRAGLRVADPQAAEGPRVVHRQAAAGDPRAVGLQAADLQVDLQVDLRVDPPAALLLADGDLRAALRPADGDLRADRRAALHPAGGAARPRAAIARPRAVTARHQGQGTRAAAIRRAQGAIPVRPRQEAVRAERSHPATP